MLFEYYSNAILSACQQFQNNNFEMINELEEGVLSDFSLRSIQKTETVYCPMCGKQHVHICSKHSTVLKDMPINEGEPLTIFVQYHRYRCQNCGHSFNEEIDFKYPGTRVTVRAAKWIIAFLRHKLSISAISELTGINWGTIRKIHKGIMEEKLEERAKELKKAGYKPKHLAVDEFAIHKGHTYATCVMDLEEGDILWVGKGRSKKEFEVFFKETDLSYLSEVEAVAMDMNASYNSLVEEYLPHAAIVYDRYHMQAQYGKEVLGVVRLDEARKHKEIASKYRELAKNSEEKADTAMFKELAKEESRSYSVLKRARWTLLRNSDTLDDKKTRSLQGILESHSDLAVCYAMKEELCNLFELKNDLEAADKWNQWFDAAEASEIPALVRFAKLKRKRLPGLIAHASHTISTGKLEGLNNKIKVSKRIAYGYRDDHYFFTLIRFLSLPSIRSSNHKSPKKS